MPAHRSLLAAVLLLATSTLAPALEPAPTEAIEDFDHFVTGAVPTCRNQPAQRCIDSGWTFIDTDTDGGISAGEISAVRATLRDWFIWRQASLTKQERSALALGLLVADSVSLDQIVASFDADADGQVSREELFADVTMDQRPLGEILADPNAVDRDAVAQRLGAAGPLLKGMLP